MEENIVYENGNWYRYSALSCPDLKPGQQYLIKIPRWCCKCGKESETRTQYKKTFSVGEPSLIISNGKNLKTGVPKWASDFVPKFNIFITYCGEEECKEYAENLVSEFETNKTKYYVYPFCRWCKKMLAMDKRKKCSRCLTAYYCSEGCQKEDWTDHKGKCIKKGTDS